MLPYDILLNILTELDSISYYKCLSVSKLFHIHTDHENANNIYMKNKYAGYSAKDLIMQGDAEGFKYCFGKKDCDIIDLEMVINEDNCNDILKIIKILANHKTNYISLTLDSSRERRGLYAFTYPEERRPRDLTPQFCECFGLLFNTQTSKKNVRVLLTDYITRKRLIGCNDGVVTLDDKLANIFNMSIGNKMHLKLLLGHMEECFI